MKLESDVAQWDPGTHGKKRGCWCKGNRLQTAPHVVRAAAAQLGACKLESMERTQMGDTAAQAPKTIRKRVKSGLKGGGRTL